MKQSIFTVVIFLLVGITTISCEKSSISPGSELTASNQNNATNIRLGAPWLAYDETNCSNPWHFDWLVKPTDEQLASNLKSYLIGIGINVIDARHYRNRKVITCDECSCLTGLRYYVRVVGLGDIEKLKAMNFYEVTVVPDPNSTTDSTSVVAK